MSTVTIVLPSILTKFTGGEKQITVSASTLGEALATLKSRYDDSLAERLFESNGEPKRLLNFYVNGKNTRLLGLLEAKLSDGDEVVILPGVSGG